MAVKLDQVSNVGLVRSPDARLNLGSSSERGRALAGVSAAAVGLGDTLSGIAKAKLREQEFEAQQEKDAQNAVRAAGILSQFEIESVEDLSGAASEFDGAGDLRTPYADRLKARRDAALEAVGDNKDLRKLVEARLVASSGNHELKALGLERMARVEATAQAASETTDITVNGVRSGTIGLEKALSDLPILIAGIAEADRESFMDKTGTQIMAAFADHKIEEGPKSFLKDLHDGTYDETFPPAIKSAAIRGARTSIKSLEVEARRIAAQKKAEARAAKRETDRLALIEKQQDQAELQYDLRDHMASISASGVPAPGVTYERVLKTMGPKPAAKFLIQEKQAHAVHEALSGLPTATPQEIADREKSLVPVPGSSDFASQQQIYGQYQKQKAAILKARAKDPAAYAAQTSGLGDLAQAGFSQDALEPLDGENEEDAQLRVRKARGVYLEASQKAQADMGISPLERRVLTKGQSEDWITSLTEGTASDQRQAAASLSQVYGNFTGSALEELKQAGLPDGYDVLVDLSERNGRGAAALADALANRKDLKKTLESDVRKNIREHAESDLAPLLNTMRFSPRAAGDIDSYVQAQEALAQQLVSAGVDKTDARARAAGEIMRGFAFNGSYRVDADIANQSHQFNIGGKTVQASGIKLVEMGMAGLARQFEDGLSSTAGNPAMDNETRRKDYAAKIRSSGTWINVINREGEERLQLVLVGPGTVNPAKNINEVVIEYSPEQLMELGKWELEVQDIRRQGRPDLQTPFNFPAPPFSLNDLGSATNTFADF